MADAQRMAPVMHRAPVPAFPAVGVVMDLGVADRVAKAEQGGKIIADVAPGVMRAVRHRHHARTVGALEPLDLACDKVERLLPGDAHIAGLAAVADVALAVRIEVDALHRMQQTVGRVDDRFGVLPVRRERRLARRRELEAARLDRPWRRVIVGEIDRGHADDLAVLDVDEHRPAVGHVAIAHAAVAHAGADLEPGGLAQHDGLREPVGEVLRPIDGELEVLLRVDLVEPVDRRRQQAGAGLGILERQRHVGVGAQPCARSHLAVADRKPAPDLLVARLDLRDEIALLEPRTERRMPPSRIFEALCQSPEDEREPRR